MEDPETFQFASTVLKASQTGLTSNRRLLVTKGGHLYYYSNVPKSFNGDSRSLDFFHELPKGSIDIIRIKRINTFNPESSQFTIYFDTMFLMQREDIHKNMTNPQFVFTRKSIKGQTNWHFACENHNIKQKWISILLQLTKYYIDQKTKAQSYLQKSNLPKSDTGHDNTNRLTSQSKLKNPWRQTFDIRKTNRMTDLKVKLQGKMSELTLKKANSSVDRALSNSYIKQENLQPFEMSYQPTKSTMQQAFKSPEKLSPFLKQQKK